MNSKVAGELALYGGVGGSALASLIGALGYVFGIGVQYVLFPAVLIALFVGGILVGTGEGGPGFVARGDIRWSDTNTPSDSDGDFSPDSRVRRLLRTVSYRSLIFLSLGVMCWGIIGIVVFGTQL